jgi:hypothetical protein
MLPIIKGTGRDVGISVIFSARDSSRGSITIVLFAAASASVSLTSSANDEQMPASIRAAPAQNTVIIFFIDDPPGLPQWAWVLLSGFGLDPRGGACAVGASAAVILTIS